MAKLYAIITISQAGRARRLVKYLKVIMSGKQESFFLQRDLQNEPRIIKIKGDRTINFVLSNVTDKNVLHITYNNEPKCDLVDKLQGLKLD